ncbi:hypothetical protein B0H14DRAFT_2922024 [Mycena olivaceomarginata]|nr:hypothetical protein B0H14DRAFT_2922024 [Mycena olivaceomarginata]
MSTLRDLRNIYGRCAVCLQCHKTAIQSVQLLEGQEQVKEAIVLGLLDPKVEYDFAHISNGTLQCLTCNAYFTQGLLVWSPPKQVLEWLDREISDAKDIDAVCKIFYSLNQVPELVHLHNYFSLIPLFPKFPEIERQDLPCVSPLPSLGRVSVEVRIFDYRTPREPGSGPQEYITFMRDPTLDPRRVSYWFLWVPCQVILYRFFKAVEYCEPSRPEISLGQKIHKALQTLGA